jgi:hypothetical protein
MGLVAQRVSDRRLLRLIRGFLTAGVMAQGLVGPTDERTPQGARCRPCCRIWCLTCWIRNWSDAVTASCAEPVLGPRNTRPRGPTTAIYAQPPGR